MRSDARPGIDIPLVALAAILLGVVVWVTIWSVAAPVAIDPSVWHELAEVRRSETIRETALETLRTRWLVRLFSPGYRLGFLILALATAVAVRAWRRLPPSASRLRRMAPALVPALVGVFLVALHLYSVAISLSQLTEQGLMNPMAVGTSIGELAIYFGWALLVAATCAIVFAVWRPSGPPKSIAIAATASRA